MWNQLYHEMFHLHPSSLALGYTPADLGLGLCLQQQERCRLALEPVLSLLSAGAPVRRASLFPPMENADRAIGASKAWDASACSPCFPRATVIPGPYPLPQER